MANVKPLTSNRPLPASNDYSGVPNLFRVMRLSEQNIARPQWSGDTKPSLRYRVQHEIRHNCGRHRMSNMAGVAAARASEARHGMDHGVHLMAGGIARHAGVKRASLLDGRKVHRTLLTTIGSGTTRYQ